MNADLNLSIATWAVALELGRRAIAQLEQTGLVSSADPATNVKLADAILIKQLADAVLAKLGDN